MLIHTDALEGLREAAFGTRAIVTLASVLVAGAAAVAEDVVVHANSHGSSVSIEAGATVHASLPVAWATITDYDHLADFIPNMTESRVIARHGAEVTVEERGDLRFLFFHFPVEVRLAVVEHYPSAIDCHSVGGNVKLVSAGYTLRRVGDGEHFELHWTGVVEPQFWTPMFITVAVLRENVERQFGAMALEIERRQALKAQGGP